jgi:hypothetical protein
LTQHKIICQVNGAVGVTVGKEREDLNAAATWAVFGCAVEDADGEEVLRLRGVERGKLRG